MSASRSRSSPRQILVAGGLVLAGLLIASPRTASAQAPGRWVQTGRTVPTYAPARGYSAAPGYPYARSPGFTPALHRGIMYSHSPYAQSPYTDDWSTARYLPYPKPWMGPR